jgi:hypothetical protein
MYAGIATFRILQEKYNGEKASQEAVLTQNG